MELKELIEELILSSETMNESINMLSIKNESLKKNHHKKQNAFKNACSNSYVHFSLTEAVKEVRTNYHKVLINMDNSTAGYPFLEKKVQSLQKTLEDLETESKMNPNYLLIVQLQELKALEAEVKLIEVFIKEMREMD